MSDLAREVQIINALSASVVADRFWLKVDRSGPVPPHCPDLGPCWAWVAHKNNRGYGTFHAGPRRGAGRSLKAHRVSWFLTTGNGPATACFTAAITRHA